MTKRINISEKLNREKVEREFQLINSFYFSEINYGKDGRFFDLYFPKNGIGITEMQIETYNKLVDRMDEYLIEINNFIKSNYTKSELKRLAELNNKKLSIDVIEILNNNQDFDSVIVCGKQYRFLRFFKRDIGIRVELKNGLIKKIERKSDITKVNN